MLSLHESPHHAGGVALASQERPCWVLPVNWVGTQLTGVPVNWVGGQLTGSSSLTGSEAS